MSAVHLRVVKLKGNRHGVTEKTFSVFAPDQKRIVINAAVHADRAVYFRLDNRRAADHLLHR